MNVSFIGCRDPQNNDAGVTGRRVTDNVTEVLVVREQDHGASTASRSTSASGVSSLAMSLRRNTSKSASRRRRRVVPYTQ